MLDGDDGNVSFRDGRAAVRARHFRGEGGDLHAQVGAHETDAVVRRGGHEGDVRIFACVKASAFESIGCLECLLVHSGGKDTINY